MNRDDVKQILQTVAGRVEGTLSKSEYDDNKDEQHPSSSTISYHFQWNEIKKEAGLDIHIASTKSLSAERTIHILQTVAQRVDSHLTVERYNAHRDNSHPSASRIERRIGWNTAKQKADLEIAESPRESMSRSQAKAALVEVSSSVDGSLTVEAYEDNRDPEQPHGYAIANKYGWNDLKDEIEIPTDARGSG